MRWQNKNIRHRLSKHLISRESAPSGLADRWIPGGEDSGLWCQSAIPLAANMIAEHMSIIWMWMGAKASAIWSMLLPMSLRSVSWLTTTSIWSQRTAII
jgi:hypothetical protein